VGTYRRAQSARGDGGGGDDEQPTSHRFSLPARRPLPTTSSAHGVGPVAPMIRLRHTHDLGLFPPAASAAPSVI
jgi:hypothetical protein